MKNSTAATEAYASERAYIGAIINGDVRAKDSGLKTSDFSDNFCKAAFSACLQLEAQNKQADLVTIFDTFPDIDSTALITLTQETACDRSLAGQHAENIRNAKQRRRAADLFLKAAQAAQNAAQPIEDTICKARIYLDKLTAQSSTEDFVSGTDALVDFFKWLENEEPDKSISTGIQRIDTKLNGGLKGGKLYVVGARTGVGKSAFMSAIAVNAIKNGAHVLYVSLEMPERENISRMIASASGVSLGRINNHSTLSDGDYGAMIEACTRLPGENFRFPKMAGTPEAVRRAALKMKAQNGIDLIVVDYLQIMQADGKTHSRVEEIGSITRELKLLAMELDIPVLTASQVSRAGTQSGGAPRLSDLRESGSIEQDSDVVFLVHCEDGQEKKDRKNIEIAIAKNRQGGTGTGRFIFDGALMRFYPLEERRNPA